MCGKGYKVAKAHPETVLPIVKVSAACGVGGALLGWAISAYRNLPTHIYTLSLGANFAVTSAVFLSELNATCIIHCHRYLHYFCSQIYRKLENFEGEYFCKFAVLFVSVKGFLCNCLEVYWTIGASHETFLHKSLFSTNLQKYSPSKHSRYIYLSTLTR